MREDCRIAKNVFKMCQNLLQFLSAHSYSIRNIIMPFLWHKAERVGLHLSWGCCRNGQQHRIKSQKIAKERGWARTMCESSITSFLFLCGLQSPSMCRLWFTLKLAYWPQICIVSRYLWANQAKSLRRVPSIRSEDPRSPTSKNLNIWTFRADVWLV